MGDTVCHHTEERKGQGFTQQRGGQRCDELLGKSAEARAVAGHRKLMCKAVALSSEVGGGAGPGQAGRRARRPR